MESMSVTVYSFEIADHEGLHHGGFKATREDIESRHGGRVIEGTDEVVLASKLDSNGRYLRWPGGWTVEQLQQIH